MRFTPNMAAPLEARNAAAEGSKYVGRGGGIS
jgi:hypothetical protein